MNAPLKPTPDFYPKPKPHPEVVVGGIKVAAITRTEAADMMVRDCMAARTRPTRPKIVFTANGNSISLAASNRDYRALVQQADLVRADGQSVVFASRLTKTPIPERSATTDFIHDAAFAARAKGLRFFILGASEDINLRATAMLEKLYPNLIICGRRNGYFRREDETAICAEINKAKPDVVWIGLGVPLEQNFAVRNRDRLRAGWLVTCGGCLNFVAGDYGRAPAWLQRAGFEWLYRLAREPRRLFWRYAVTNPHALWLMLTRTRSVRAA